VSGRLRRRIVIAAVVLGVVGVGGTAVAASSSGGNTFLDDVARHLGIAPAKLQSAINQAYADRLNQLVKEGKLTQAQANALEKRAKSHGGVPFAGPFGGPFEHHAFRPGMRPFAGGPFATFQAAAKYLGISQATLFSDMRSGKTLAAIAKAKGKSVSGLEQAIESATKTQLDAAVSAGHLTKSQASKIEAGLAARIDALVNHGFKMGERDHDHDGWGGSAKGGGGSGSAPAGWAPPTQAL
jgi:AraC-like DNA-binding protein